MRRIWLICFIIIFFYLPVVQAQLKLTNLVDPFIGTGGHGHTFPGAVVPFGMVQLSPDNGRDGWDWCSGYHYSDSVITGFSHTHLSGTGIGDWQDVSVMPLTSPLEAMHDSVSQLFNHKYESAKPGYYSVVFRNGIKVELTATERCGFHRYQFPEQSIPVIRFDLGYAHNWDAPTETYITVVNDSTITGYRYSTGWANVQKVYFAARTSIPFSKTILGDGTTESDMTDIMETVDKGKGVTAQLVFSPSAAKSIELRVALSMTSYDKALKALDANDFTFDQARKQADEKWETELEKIQINSSDENLKRVFYTALYHTCIAPVLYSDEDGEYKNAKGEIKHPDIAAQRYTVYSLWDTFRALNPLFTLTQTSRYADILNSMLRFYDENGLLPVWDLSTCETNTMSGYHAVPVLADAVLKDWPGVDANRAYTAMIASANQSGRGVPDYIKYGYEPQDKHNVSVTITLEYAFDDYCIAQVAKKLGKEVDYEVYMKRAHSYANLFDNSTGFMRAKNSDGKFVTPFDPFWSEHDGARSQYVEGNAWQHSFFVPQDVNGLAALYGGQEQLGKKLDSLFTVSSVMHGNNTSPDVSGMMGQYAHGNEPSHHIAYMYTYIGEAWKTQEKVRQITESMYQALPDGYAGNEDCGQMSAWAVWSMAGLYPANAASGEYIIGSPQVDDVSFNVGNNRKMTIKALNNSRQNKYVQKVRLNGKPYLKTFISHTDFKNGGELEIEMGAKPNKKWGKKKESWPTSASD